MKAVTWARKYGMKVLIDVHGSPGSQNGFDNSGHAGTVAWQTGDYLAKTTSVLVQVAKKYGTAAFADVVWGIELTNEPISWGANDNSVTKSWTQSAYAAVRNAAPNKNLNIIMHDAFMGPASWTGVGANLNRGASMSNAKFFVDTHLYQNQVAADSTLAQWQHIAKACKWRSTDLLPASDKLPVIVGEFSAATNICVYPDGTTTAGTTCNKAGCQCPATLPWVANWNAQLKIKTRRFFEAQIDTFEKQAQGWFMWSYKGYGGWSMEQLFEGGVLGPTVMTRKYPHVCG